jgi:hypothetical protein
MVAQGCVKVPATYWLQRGRTSLAVGETHGRDPPCEFDPYKVGYFLALDPQVSPTANEIVPLRGISVVGQFDVEAALRRHLARSTRRYLIKLTHYRNLADVDLAVHVRGISPNRAGQNTKTPLM